MSASEKQQQKRTSHDYPAPYCSSMAELRTEIDQLDRNIVELLRVRQGFIEQAARIKQDRNLIRDPARIEDVIEKTVTHAKKVGAHPALIEKLYRDMIEWSIAYEMTVFEQASPDGESS